MLGEHSAREAYDRFAPIYDEFNASNNYEMWLGEVLLPELERHGLRRFPAATRPQQVLDIGCGTGRAFPPLLKRGWHITGCDASPVMLGRAQEKTTSESVALLECDARELVQFAVGPFDLVLALNDVVNYLTEDGDLDRAFAGMKRNLAPHGLVCFDTDTLGLFRSHFASGNAEEMSVGDWEWHGLEEEVRPGGIYEARVSGPGVETHIHRERHWTPGKVEEALAGSGLRALAVMGQREEGDKILLEDPFDEERDQKLIWMVGHAG